MNHYCPECMVEKNEVDIEAYSCEKCKDTFCVHFMKDTRASVVKYGTNKKMLPFDGETKGESICWVCGSHKKDVKQKSPFA